MTARLGSPDDPPDGSADGAVAQTSTRDELIEGAPTSSVSRLANRVLPLPSAPSRMIGRRWTFLAAASIAGKRCVQSCPRGRQNAHALLLNVKMEAIAGV